MKKTHDPKKPFHTIHGDHAAPRALPDSWLENDENLYFHPHASPPQALPDLEDLEAVRWHLNLDGLEDVFHHRQKSPSSTSSLGSPSSETLSPVTSPDRSPARSPPATSPERWHQRAPVPIKLQIPAYPATVPKTAPPRLRPTLPASFFSEQPSRPKTPQSEKRFRNRFIPGRDSPAATPRSEMYRLTKCPCELTTSEMILRHRGDTPDPFTTAPKPPRQGDRRNVSESRPPSSASTTGPTGPTGPTVLSTIETNTNSNSFDAERQISYGSTWSVGGLAPMGSTVNNGHGGLVQSGTNVPVYTTTYPTWTATKSQDIQKHRDRLASALDIDRANRVLGICNKPISTPGYSSRPMRRKSFGQRTHWTGHRWEKDTPPPSKNMKVSEARILPGSPFKVLDAPGLRDDFYCSILAFSPTCGTLAVGLGNTVYGWSERNGVTCLNAGIPGEEESVWITSLAFSSAEGGKSILAVGRSSGKVALLSLFDSMVPRFELVYAHAVTALAWRPRTSVRTSKSPYSMPGCRAKSEDLLVGDEKGRLWYYSVEWPDAWEVKRNGWSGRPTLLVRIQAHNQQICGLSWSQNGNLFASGGNDDFCSLFDVKMILGDDDESIIHEAREQAERARSDLSNRAMLRKLFGNASRPCWMSTKVPPPKNFGVVPPLVTIRDKGKRRITPSGTRDLTATSAKHRWRHGAAVKAIAFCPWRTGLLATGGGSHDKAIHFYHTTTGAALATIAVSAQVTSLIWSKTKREIAACFGYAQPEHAVRIAVFNWPECKQVASIPWDGEMRALCAVGWPMPTKKTESKESPKTARRSRRSAPSASWDTLDQGKCKENITIRDRRSEEGTGSVGRGTTPAGKGQREMWEGCIVVAASDESVKFHEVWEADNKIAAGGPGMLGGSDILEGLEGIDKDGEIIR